MTSAMTSDYTEPAVDLGTGRMPLLGFGTWQISDGASPGRDRIGARSGVPAHRHRDRLPNERGIGRALAAAGLEREAIFVTTKLPPENAGRERPTLEESLSRLGTDYVDLWLIHWPPDRQASPPVWEEMIKARQDGLARSIGVSNYSLDQIDELTDATGVTPAVNQIRWGPMIYDRTVATGLAERGVVLEGYSPFKASNLNDRDAAGDRRGARRHARPDRGRLARRARLRRHPQVDPARTHRGQRRRCPDRAHRRRGRRPSTASP